MSAETSVRWVVRDGSAHDAPVPRAGVRVDVDGHPPWHGATDAEGVVVLPSGWRHAGPARVRITADEVAVVTLPAVDDGEVWAWGAVGTAAGAWSPPRLAAVLAWVTLVALGLRLVAWHELASTPLAGDEREYLLTARRTVEGGLGWLWDTSRPLGTLRPVASTLWYGLVAAVGGATPQALRLGNVVLGALLPWPVFAVGRHLGGVRVGLLAAALVAVHPDLVLYSTSLWTEPLYLLALAAGLALLLARSPRIGVTWPAAGACLAVALLTRDVGLLLPVAALAWAAVARPETLAHRARAIAAAACVWACLVGAWSWRLHAADGPAGIVSGVASMNLYLGNTTNDPPYDALGDDAASRDAAAHTRAIEAIVADLPAWPLRKLAITSPRFYTGAGLDTERLVAARGGPLRLHTRHEALESDTTRVRIARVLFGGQALLGVVGIAGLVLAATSGWTRTRRVAALLLLLVALHQLPTVVTFAKPRFALPTVPCWILGTSWLLVRGRDAWSRAPWTVRLAVAATLVVAAWAFLRWVPRELRVPGA